MSDERRYGEGEVDEIFALAADESADLAAGLGGDDGLTLAELQEIGEEAGLSPERVAAAAASIDAALAVPAVPDAAGHTEIELPRAPTDEEWELLVGELRTTFGAPGQVVSRGDAREWRDGDLHVFVEPSAAGSRLRMIDQHSPNAAAGLFGWGVLIVGAVLLVTGGLDAATFGATWELLLPLLLVVAGGGSLAGVAWQDRRRTALRDRQMARIAARARELTEAP